MPHIIPWLNMTSENQNQQAPTLWEYRSWRFLGKNGGDGARTRDIQIDSLALYPTELRPQDFTIHGLGDAGLEPAASCL